MSATENRLGMDGWWANLTTEVAAMLADAEQRGRSEVAGRLGDVRKHLKEMRTFLAVETPDAVGTRRRNDRILAEVSDLIRKTEGGAA